MEIWKEGKLKEFAVVKGGKRLPKGKQLIKEPNSHPYIRIRDLGKSKVIELTLDYEYVDDETQESISRYIVSEGDLLISVVGTIGLIGIVGRSLNNANQTENCDKIINIRGLDRDYLYYYLISAAGQDEIRIGTVGAVQPKLPLKNVQDIKIKYPSIETQKKIASILNVIDEKIKTNESINRNLTEQFRAIVDDFVENLEDYRLMRLDEVAECQNGHAFYKDGYDESGAFVIDLGNVNTSANFVYTNGDKYISIDRYEQSKLEKYHVFKDDLVMVMTDRKSTMDLLGKTGKIYKDGYYLLNQRMYRIRAKDNINVNYLYAILNSSKVCNSLKEKALGSVQKYVNTKEINEIEIMLPTPEKMEELAQVVNPISSKMETNILENENLHNLRDELLPKLMSGELDVSDLDI